MYFVIRLQLALAYTVQCTRPQTDLNSQQNRHGTYQQSSLPSVAVETDNRCNKIQ